MNINDGISHNSHNFSKPCTNPHCNNPNCKCGDQCKCTSKTNVTVRKQIHIICITVPNLVPTHSVIIQIVNVEINVIAQLITNVTVRKQILQKMMLSKFVDELPIPPVLKPRWKDQFHTYYEVNMTEFKQSLHSELNDTTVWGYEGSYPGPTIEVESGEKVFIKWNNNLPEKHLLPVDYTVHGAHMDVPEVRTVVHVHGACVESESDGYPEAWFTKGFKQVGRYFRKQVYQYDNYIKHAPFGIMIIRLGLQDLTFMLGWQASILIRDQRERLLNLPSGKYEIPLIIQDKTFNNDGSLFYPKQPDQPIPELETSVVPQFIGETILVNGKVHPYLKVEPRKYRFRLLNGSNTRFFRMKLDSGQLMYQISNGWRIHAVPDRSKRNHVISSRTSRCNH